MDLLNNHEFWGYFGSNAVTEEFSHFIIYISKGKYYNFLDPGPSPFTPRSFLTEYSSVMANHKVPWSPQRHYVIFKGFFGAAASNWWYTVLPYKRVKGERGNSENVSVVSAGAYTTTWLMVWWLHRVRLLLCPSNIFRHGNKNTLFLVMIYSAQFNHEYKASNLFLGK